MRLVNGIGIFRLRPIFNFGPQFKALTFFSVVPGRRFASLMSAGQRLQIALGDGNLCDEAEYLKIATTMLVLDAIESGHRILVPELRHPMRALRAIVADPSLSARVPTVDGKSMSALEIQRIYLNACREFVTSCSEVPVEVHDILQRWERVLDDLELAPDRLVGRLDWVTKRWLIDTSGKGALWEARKKLDLRYHELSPDGYFERLRSTGVIEEILTEQEVSAAMSEAPKNTPATLRGRHIRELAGSGKEVRANWRSVTVGKPGKVIRLT
jgi:proteasome accessory factor A